MLYLWWWYTRWLNWLSVALGWERDPESPEEEEVILFDDDDT